MVTHGYACTRIGHCAGFLPPSSTTHKGQVMIVSVPVASFVCHRCLSSCGATDQEQRERGLWSQAGLDLNSTAAISSGQTTQILGWGWEQGKVERKLGSESWDLILVLRRGGGRRQGHCPMPPALSRTVGATAGHWQPSAQGTRFQGVKKTRVVSQILSHAGLKLF